jgi:anhydro-N-acetylmuramic acid kinase
MSLKAGVHKMVNEKKYRVVGVMSGTSLDGLDLALCQFSFCDEAWNFEIEKGITIPYSPDWKQRLGNAQFLNAFEFVQLHNDFGQYIGQKVNEFICDGETVDFIASHGHTVFHEPKKGITCQIGAGTNIAVASKLKVVSDFRILDVALGGQGAPLVPIGDEYLFHHYDACVNLGGFANISFKNSAGERVAFDISPINIVLNQLMEDYYSKPYDDNGAQGKIGECNTELLQQLNGLVYYKIEGPKSLSREWVENQFVPVIKTHDFISHQDILTTCYYHFAYQLAEVFSKYSLNRVLFTGGGAYNAYLLNLLKSISAIEIVVPDKEIIEFKEALIFAFLGVLRVEEINNCLSTVTGAKKDNCGGVIIWP